MLPDEKQGGKKAIAHKKEKVRSELCPIEIRQNSCKRHSVALQKAEHGFGVLCKKHMQHQIPIPFFCFFCPDFFLDAADSDGGVGCFVTGTGSTFLPEDLDPSDSLVT